jgi:hypothetical protein
MVVKLEDIVNAQGKVAQIVLDQASHGAQTKAIQKVDPELFSLGQFLGQPDREQRGVHGSATGLRVLAAQDASKIVAGIVRYLENRVSIDGISGDEKLHRIQRDEHNTIKISEILYALSFVKTGFADKDKYIRKLVESLGKGRRNRGGQVGWRFFIDDENDEPEMLPTAFAVIALSVNGFKDGEAEETLRTHLEAKQITDPTSLAEVVFALYAVLRSNDDDYKANKGMKSTCDKVWDRIWNSEFFSLANQYEQNVEYWYQSHHEYIRIPWQLYYLFIASRLNQWKFYAVSTQRLLKSIIDFAKNQSFRYPYSGFNISTRTNAILFDILKSIEKNFDSNSIYSAFYKLRVGYFNIRLFFGKKIIRWCLAIIGLAMLSFSVISWVKDPNSRMGSMANEFIGWIVIGLILLGKKK